jgi:hypothetical protein
MSEVSVKRLTDLKDTVKIWQSVRTLQIDALELQCGRS